MTIGERITIIRGTISRRAFANSIGIVENTLRNYEQGFSLPNSDVLFAICKEFGVSPNWLLLDQGPMKADETPIFKNIEAGASPENIIPEQNPQKENQPNLVETLLAHNRTLEKLVDALEQQIKLLLERNDFSVNAMDATLPGGRPSTAVNNSALTARSTNHDNS